MIKRDEKPQYNINRETAKYQYYHYLPIKVKLQNKLSLSPSGKVLEKQINVTEDAAKKQANVIKERSEKQVLNTNQKLIRDLFSKDFLAAEATDALNKFTNIEGKITKDDLIYKIGNKKIINHMNFKR